MDDRQLRDEAMTILLAGHETTANALTYTFLLLSRYPAALRELRAELSQVLGGRSPTLEDLPRLTLTRWTLQESMRLYPPAWIIARSANGADEIGGHEIPRAIDRLREPVRGAPASAILVRPGGVRSRPIREGAAARAYLPFGAGPRMCHRLRLREHGSGAGAGDDRAADRLRAGAGSARRAAAEHPRSAPGTASR